MYDITIPKYPNIIYMLPLSKNTPVDFNVLKKRHRGLTYFLSQEERNAYRIKTSRYVDKLELDVRNDLYNMYKKKKTNINLDQIYKKFDQNDKKLAYINIEELKNKITATIPNIMYNGRDKKYPSYLKIETIFTPNTINKVDIWSILNMAEELQSQDPEILKGLFEDILYCIHDYFLTKTLIDYKQLINQIIRLSSDMYNISIKLIKLEKYKQYINKFTKEIDSSIINRLLINNSENLKDTQISYRLFELLFKSKSITIVSYFATKIEKDIILIKFKNTISLLKTNNIHLTDEQLTYLQSIIKTKIEKDINLFNDKFITDIEKYINLDNTNINEALKLNKIIKEEKKTTIGSNIVGGFISGIIGGCIMIKQNILLISIIILLLIIIGLLIYLFNKKLKDNKSKKGRYSCKYQIFPLDTSFDYIL